MKDMKRLLSFLFLFAYTVSLMAGPSFISGKKYRIVCEKYQNYDGCVADGSWFGQDTPVFYLLNTAYDKDDENYDKTYWYIKEEVSGCYSIQNAGTEQYVTYTGEKTGSNIRYVAMTSSFDEEEAYKSFWTFEQISDYYFVIRNAYVASHVWDVRDNSYVVGSYPEYLGNNNQHFYFTDEEGNIIGKAEEVVPDPTSGFNVSSWLAANTNSRSDKWENDGWLYHEGGYYYNGEASVVSPFYENWHRSEWGPLADCSLSQTLYNLPAGDYTLQADMIAVRQESTSYSIEEEMGIGVTLFAGDEEVNVSTYDEAPIRYTVDFTVDASGTVSLGVKAENTNANWLAIDNIFLYYRSTESDLINGELAKLRAEAVGKMTEQKLEAKIAATDGSFEQLEQLRQTIINMPDAALGHDVTSWLAANSESMNEWESNGWWLQESYFSYQNGAANVITPFVEIWTDKSNGSIYDNYMQQTIKNLPVGKYTLHADMIANNQRWDEPAYNITLFANDNEVYPGTYNGVPEHYTLDFNVDNDGTATLGVRAESTNANWIALDNLQLFFQGTEEELIAGELNKVRSDAFGRLDEKEVENRIAATDGSFEQLEELRLDIMRLPMPDPLSLCAKDITIKDRPLTYVESLGLYLCSISLKHFGTDFTDIVSYTSNEGYGDMVIDGTPVANGSTYTFANVSAGKTYNISFSNGNQIIEMPVTFTSLPVVQLTGDFGYNYNEGYIRVAQPNKKGGELLNMKAKWRGGITNTSGKNKRNYHVKLLDEEGNKLEKRYFDIRKDNSWILESCQVDMSRIRNRVLTDLWNDYCVMPYYFDQEPEALTGTRGRFVELVLNDEYRGIYCMTENMDRKQMKLKKYDEDTKEVHGQLWKSKDWSYAVFMGHYSDNNYYPGTSPSGYSNNSESWDSYNLKYPDFEDVNPTDWSVLYNAVDFVCTASDDEFRAHIGEYFDLPVVIDYYILMETILSTDNHGKNMFFGVYDKQVDKKITLSVWDMDATCGQRWSDQYYHQSFLGPEQDYAQFITSYEHGDYNLFRRLRNTNAENFNLKVRKRYRELRQDNLDTDSILRRFQNYFNEFKTAGADKREYNKWSYNSDVSGLELNFGAEFDYLTDWFIRRMIYLDDIRFDIKSLPLNGDANGDGVVSVADVTALVNKILGRTQENFDSAAGDVNTDDNISVADVTGVVNLILHRSSKAPKRRIIEPQ